MRDPVVAPAANRTLTCQFNLTDKNATDLGLHKQDLSKYRVVDLSQNKFTHEALHYILPCCARIPGLEILKLHKNRIGDLGAEQLADFCKRSTTLRELHLSHNCFTAHGAVIIVHAAERSRSLCRSPLWLRLERNAVEHPAEVADALQQTLSVCFRVDRTACNSARCCKNCKVHLPYFLRQNTSQTDSGGGSAALCEVDDSMCAAGSPSKKPVQHLEDRMRAAGPSGAHAIENLECLPEPKLQLQLGASRMLKRRLSNRHVPGLQQESSTDKLANWCQTAWDAGNPCKRSNTKTNDEQACPKMPSKPLFASTATGDPLKSLALGAETAVELPPFPPLPLIPKPQQTPDSAMPGRCMLKPRRGDQAQGGAEGLQESVVMAKVDELSAWHEELKAREKYLHLCEDTVRELLLSEVQPNALDVDDREKSAMRQLEAWANGQDGPMASVR